jgi:D-threo-aldose 1-dehydrogenase
MMPITSRPLGHTGIKLPALGLGGAPLGELFQRIKEDDAQEMLQAAWNCGIRYFDTAPWYGHGLSEHRIGHLLRQQGPTAFICSTKVGRVYTRFAGRASESVTAPWAGGLPFVPRFDYTYDGIMRSYEDSLMRLGLNRVQALVVHDLDFGYHQTELNITARLRELESGWKALDELKCSAEIAAIGVGINEESMMGRFLERWAVDFFLVAMPYTLIDQNVLNYEFPTCASRGVGIVVGAPYASGILATGPVTGAMYRYAPASAEVVDKVSRIQAVCERHGVPLKAAALQFPLAHPIVACVIPGALRHEHVRENRELFDLPIPSDFWAELQFARLIHENAPLPLGD